MSRKARNNVTLLGGFSSKSSHGPKLPYDAAAAGLGISPNVPGRGSNGRSWVFLKVRCRDSESSVDDLGTWRGVVLGRAVTTLRSVETQPLAWGFVLSVRRGPVIFVFLFFLFFFFTASKAMRVKNILCDRKSNAREKYCVRSKKQCAWTGIAHQRGVVAKAMRVDEYCVAT